MEDTHPRTDVQLLPAPHEHVHDEGEGSPRVVTLATPDLAYTCLACGSAWQYREVRNTGRCPSCGGGLRRDSDWP